MNVKAQSSFETTLVSDKNDLISEQQNPYYGLRSMVFNIKIVLCYMF